MTKYYDITFHELSGKSVIKREVLTEKEPFEAWQDACVSYTDQVLNIQVNEDKFITMDRRYIVRVDAEEVDGPAEKQMKRRDELMGVVNILSNMGI
ncbi:hypothetical protein IW492_03890 [Enterococcus sp. BWB1-3]|uniref:hypothetical protein n=1 Tax=unclassified Enterococcus TaxID=2608891 RepID=UPI00192448B7|nr:MULTISPECIES: hypothetical protein [unclassified Enterococcus]MBL1228373.1 hypothetical protein [Enterococcus sp. BWB1-3]MCB5951189.1 hypothetical protein [Enterococcus sp. BWT-B8]MCB5954867.1 hypothetical protein [Enterococcus sp. CWB-B31]